MRVVWQDIAKVGRQQVSAYIRKEFGTKRAKKFRQEVGETINLLCNAPNIGSIDPLFADRPQTYRSIIIDGLSKMIYRIDGDTIYIAAFWDTRREPKGQAEKLK